MQNIHQNIPVNQPALPVNRPKLLIGAGRTTNNGEKKKKNDVASKSKAARARRSNSSRSKGKPTAAIDLSYYRLPSGIIDDNQNLNSWSPSGSDAETVLNLPLENVLGLTLFNR